MGTEQSVAKIDVSRYSLVALMRHGAGRLRCLHPIQKRTPVRSHEVPFILENGQIIGRLVYEPLTEVPSQVYGQGIGSNYQR